MKSVFVKLLMGLFLNLFVLTSLPATIVYAETSTLTKQEVTVYHDPY